VLPVVPSAVLLRGLHMTGLPGYVPIPLKVLQSPGEGERAQECHSK